MTTADVAPLDGPLPDTTFVSLSAEFHADVVGARLYGEIVGAVRDVVRRGYPPAAYSPTKRWDDDAIRTLAHEWLEKKLLGLHHLNHLLLANEAGEGGQALAGFRHGLRLYFRDFLVGTRARSALGNLFRRSDVLLERDGRFRCVVDAKRKAQRVWALAAWDGRQPFAGSEEELIAAGFRVRGYEPIRFRPDARKESPVLLDPDLADFIAAVLAEVGAPLSLAQLCGVFRYRFHLLAHETLSLDEVVAEDADSGGLSRGARAAAPAPAPDEALVLDEVARAVLDELPPRQRRSLVGCARPGATLVSVAKELGCSKSTVENELKRALALIGMRTDSADEAQAVYARVLELIAEQ